jgi:hypothetical protein
MVGVAPHAPGVQCHGMWATLPDDPLDAATRRRRSSWHIPSKHNDPLAAIVATAQA